MNKWAQALEHLRQRKGWSKYKTCKMAHMPREQYNNMLHRSRMGPSAWVLERLLVGLGYTWHDWADACDVVDRAGGSLAAEEHPPAYGVRIGGEDPAVRKRSSQQNDESAPATK